MKKYCRHCTVSHDISLFPWSKNRPRRRLNYCEKGRMYQASLNERRRLYMQQYRNGAGKEPCRQAVRAAHAKYNYPWKERQRYEVDNLSDGYVRHCVVQDSILVQADVPPVLVQQKRANILAHRLIRKIDK